MLCRVFFIPLRSDCLVFRFFAFGSLSWFNSWSIIPFQCNSQEGMEGNPNAGTIKTVSRVFAALSIPLTASFPKVCVHHLIVQNFTYYLNFFSALNVHYIDLTLSNMYIDWIRIMLELEFDTSDLTLPLIDIIKQLLIVYHLKYHLAVLCSS